MPSRAKTSKPADTPTMNALADQIRAAGKAPTSPPKETDMYGHMVDLSTPESKARTLMDASTAARMDAHRLGDQADKFRTEAAALDDKPGMVSVAEDLRRQATALEEDVSTRQGMARAYDEAAAELAAERAGVGV